MADLAETLAACLATAEELISHPDQTGAEFITGAGSTESQPPWNAAAADAILTPHYELRVLERDLRAMVTGAARLRGGSAGNTAEALAALPALATALPTETVSLILAKLDRWVHLTMALPAVDGLAAWEPIPVPSGRPVCLDGCGTTLRRSVAYRVVACIKPACRGIRDGRRPWGRIAHDPEGGHHIRWSDGRVQALRLPR